MRVPSYRLHRSSGQAVVTLSGRDHYLGPHNTPESKAAYQRIVAEWLAGGRHLRPVPGNVITVAEVVLAYCAAGENRDTRDKRVLPVVVQLYGAVPVTEFGPLALEACRAKIVGRGWTRKSVNLAVGRIKTMLRWAVSKEMAGGDKVMAALTLPGLRAGRSPAAESQPIEPVPDAHVDAVLPHLSPQLRAVVELMRLTGMRPGEALAISPGRIDRSGPAGCWVYRPTRHKTQSRGHSRAVLIGPRGQAVLMPWMNRPAGQECFRPCETARANSGARPSGTVYRTTTLGHAIARACRTAGVPHWHPHQLRHAAASRVRAAAGLDAAQVILGHRHAQTTEIYAEADRAKAAEIMAKVG
mgnify:CR=1 FL=1